MRCECLACGSKFKTPLAFSDHQCEKAGPKPLRRRTASLTRMSFSTLLQKSNTPVEQDNILA